MSEKVNLEEKPQGDAIRRTTLKAKEAARYIGISYCKLLTLVKQKKVPAIPVDNRFLFRKETLDAWMSERENQSLIGAETGLGRLRKLR